MKMRCFLYLFTSVVLFNAATGRAYGAKRALMKKPSLLPIKSNKSFSDSVSAKLIPRGGALLKPKNKSAATVVIVWYCLQGYFSCFAPGPTCKAIGFSDNATNRQFMVSQGTGRLALATIAFLLLMEICNSYTAIGTSLIMYIGYIGHLLLNEVPRKIHFESLPLKLWMVFQTFVVHAIFFKTSYVEKALACVTFSTILAGLFALISPATAHRALYGFRGLTEQQRYIARSNGGAVFSLGVYILSYLKKEASDKALGYAIAASGLESMMHIVTRGYQKADVNPLPIFASLTSHCAIAYILLTP